MYLKELTITGFKSFAKKSELEFSTPITAIVGPNGSGKSNVAEAFRFVLGEQSPSKMRGKKGEDLIWGGSDAAARANRASVSIVLNNEGRVFPLDFDEITIERSVMRDGANEYSINGSRSRLKDVHELLAAGNIGTTGHHIISQGEADRILSATAKERREMIEDALGLKVYQYKKAESEKKLAKTRENIEQVESLRREVAPHLKFLERQVKKIEKSEELRKELSAAYAEYLKREDVYVAHHHDRLTRMSHQLSGELEELSAALSDAKERLEASKKDEKSEALVSVEEKIAKIRKERQEVVREIGTIEGQVSLLERRIEAQEKKASEHSAASIPHETVAETVEAVRELTHTAADATDVDTLRSTLTEIQEKLDALLTSTATEEADTPTDDDAKERADLSQRHAALESELDRITAAEERARREYDEIRTSIEEEHGAEREAEREVFTIMNEQREKEHEKSAVTEELRALERARDEFKRELQEAVALVGRSASQYFSHEIVVDGAPVTKEEILSEDREKQQERRRALEKMKVRLEELGAGASEEVMKEYQDVKERDEFLVGEIDDLTTSAEKLESLIADLTDQLNEHFATGIEKIDTEFGRFFELMFGGGEAKLERVTPKVRKKKTDDEDDETDDDEADETQEGIEIDVKLPNKRVRGLDMLSGGERALTSIALIFAMSQVNPPPFVILDETDAALDEANSRRYGDMITALSERSQLILITHNRETMSRAGVLYGVTMGGDGVSKLLSVKFEEAVSVAK